MTRPIGKLIIIIEDMILLQGDPGFGILDPLLINQAEQVIEVRVENDGLLITGLNEFEADNEYHVFPNPFSAQVQICSNENEIGDIQFFNSQGRLIKLTTQKQNTCWRADFSTFPAGMYYLRTTSGDKSHLTRLVKTQ